MDRTGSFSAPYNSHRSQCSGDLVWAIAQLAHQTLTKVQQRIRRIFLCHSSLLLTGGIPRFLSGLPRARSGFFLAIVITLLSSVSNADSEELITFNIPRQRADISLTQFAEQANRTFVFPYDQVREVTTAELVGTFTAEEAIHRLLEGSGLTPVFSEEGLLSITTGVDNMNVKKPTGIIAALAALFGASGGEVIAQNAEPAQSSQARLLEEMVVTAQKREQSLQDVPVTVNALSGEAMEAQGVDTLFEVADLVPGMVFSRAPDDGLALTLRGLGTPARTQSFDQSVALFLDGMFVGKGRMYSSAFFDVERMEVIKGTQSTLLGKNTSLGAISLVTRKPGDELAGNIKASLEFENGGKTVDAGVDLPISEDLAVRVAGHYVDQDGWVENLFTGRDVPIDNDLGARITAVYTPTDNLDATFVYQYSDSERTGNGFQFVAYGEEFIENVVGVGDGTLNWFDLQTEAVQNYIGEMELNDTKTAICPECPGGESFHDTEVDSATLTLNYDMGDHLLTSVSSYAKYDLQFWDDFDFGAAFAYATYLADPSVDPSTLAYSTYFFREEDYNQFSQELRITSPAGEKLEYLAGLFYFDSDWDSAEQQNFRTPDFAPPAPDAPPPGELFNGTFTNVFTQQTETVSLFGQATLNFSDRLRSTLGLRYTDETKDVSFVRVQGETATIWNTFANPPFGEDVGGDLDFSDSFVNGNFNVQFDATDSSMLYASYGVGSKTGGFAESAEVISGDPSLNVDDGGARVETETAKTIELGAKLSLLDGAAELNIALFDTQVDDFQETSFQVSDGAAAFLTRNIDAESKGFEIDGQWQATDALRISGGVTKADSTNAADGSTLAQAPEYTGSLNLLHETMVGDNMLFSINAAARYRDEMVSQINETFPSDSLTTYDLSFTLESLDNTWRLSLVGTNITDEVATDFSGPPAAPILEVPPGDLVGITAEAPSALRTISLQASYNF